MQRPILAAVLQLDETFDNLAAPEDMWFQECQRNAITANAYDDLQIGTHAKRHTPELVIALYSAYPVTFSIILRFRNGTNTVLIQSDPVEELSMMEIIVLESSSSTPSMHSGCRLALTQL